MEERKVPGKNEFRKREPVIQVKNLYKVYRVGETKVYALNGVDFTMYRGEFCAIVFIMCRQHIPTAVARR